MIIQRQDNIKPEYHGNGYLILTGDDKRIAPCFGKDTEDIEHMWHTITSVGIEVQRSYHQVDVETFRDKIIKIVSENKDAKKIIDTIDEMLLKQPPQKIPQRTR